MKKLIYMTHADLRHRVYRLAEKLEGQRYEGRFANGHIRIWPVDRDAEIAANLLAIASPYIRIVRMPTDADLALTDLITTGETRDKVWHALTLPLHALIDLTQPTARDNPGAKYIFPYQEAWNSEKSGD